MSTPMAPNFANLFMDQLENNIINEFYEKHHMRPLVWIRYIDDIFFIWTGSKESLNTFVSFANDYTDNKNEVSHQKTVLTFWMLK